MSKNTAIKKKELFSSNISTAVFEGILKLIPVSPDLSVNCMLPMRLSYKVPHITLLITFTQIKQILLPLFVALNIHCYSPHHSDCVTTTDSPHNSDCVTTTDSPHKSDWLLHCTTDSPHNSDCCIVPQTVHTTLTDYCTVLQTVHTTLTASLPQTVHTSLTASLPQTVHTSLTDCCTVPQTVHMTWTAALYYMQTVHKCNKESDLYQKLKNNADSQHTSVSMHKNIPSPNVLFAMAILHTARMAFSTLLLSSLSESFGCGQILHMHLVWPAIPGAYLSPTLVHLP